MTNMKKAFTIVELLVVMAVIGILITLAVVGIQAIQKAQRETTRLNDIQNLSGMLSEYFAKYRQYPKTVSYDDATSDIKVDSLGPNVGFCLYVPGNGIDNDCDVDIINPSIKYSNVLFSPGIFNSDTFVDSVNQPQIVDYTAHVCPNIIGSDHYEVYYLTRDVQTPQEFMLSACLESGKTQNFGSLNSL